MGKSCYTIRSNRFGEAIDTDGKYIPVCDLPFEAQVIMHNYFMTPFCDYDCYLATYVHNTGETSWGLLIHRTFNSTNPNFTIGTSEWGTEMENIYLDKIGPLIMDCEKILKESSNAIVFASKFTGVDAGHEFGIYIKCSDETEENILDSLFKTYVALKCSREPFSLRYTKAFERPELKIKFENDLKMLMEVESVGNYNPSLRGWTDIDISINGETFIISVLHIPDNNLNEMKASIRSKVFERAQHIISLAQESGKEYSTKQIVGWAAHDLIPLQWGIKDTD